MFRNIMRFLVNGISVMGQKVIDGINAVVSFVWKVIKTVINWFSRVTLNIVDEIKSYFSDQEKCNKFILSTGKALAGMIILFVLSNQTLYEFFVDWKQEEIRTLLGVLFFMGIVFILYASYLWIRQFRERNITNGYKVTNYKLFGEEPCKTFYRVFTTSRPNLIP